MLNWTLRYLPVIDLLEHLGLQTVLDVGSGWHGIGEFRSGPVTQTDMHLDGSVNHRRANVRYVQAAGERLPFKDDAYEAVVALDLLEHVNVDLRPAVIRETTRVASNAVILAFPASQPAAVVDRRLHVSLKRLRRPVPAWLTQHVEQAQYPDARLVFDALPAGWKAQPLAGLSNVWITYVVALSEELPGLHRLTNVVDRWCLRRRRVPGFVSWGTSYRSLWLLVPSESQPSCR